MELLENKKVTLTKSYVISPSKLNRLHLFF